MKIDEFVQNVYQPARLAVLIPTNTLDPNDPRLPSARGIARWQKGVELARRLRDHYSRASVLLLHFGGWSLHDRLPLALHHAHWAINSETLGPDELDMVAAHGVNTVGDLRDMLGWLDVRCHFRELEYGAVVVTSKGHGQRMIAESNMHRFFKTVNWLESGEERSFETEDHKWAERARQIPAYQFALGGRWADVQRHGAADGNRHAAQMAQWAHEHPEQYEQYRQDIWQTIGELERSNVIVRSDAPGCMRLEINAH